MLRPVRFTAIFFIFFALAPGLFAALSIPPKPNGYVTDKAGMLSAAARSRIETALRRYENQTSNQVVVVTFPSLEGESLEDFSIRLAEKWKIGQKDKNNGVIFLIFKNDRKMRIEVGYGLEGALTDAIASSIIFDIARPNFREGNYDKGISESLDAIIAATKGEFKGVRSASREVASTTQSFMIFLVFALIAGLGIIDLFRFWKYRSTHCLTRSGYNFRQWWVHFSWLYMLSQSSGGSSGSWSSGSSRSSGGGGGFSGGGGSFGGGGSSGGW